MIMSKHLVLIRSLSHSRLPESAFFQRSPYPASHGSLGSWSYILDSECICEGISLIYLASSSSIPGNFLVTSILHASTTGPLYLRKGGRPCLDGGFGISLGLTCFLS